MIAELKKESQFSCNLNVFGNKAWKQHPTKQYLYVHLPTISQTIQINPERNFVRVTYKK